MPMPMRPLLMILLDDQLIGRVQIADDYLKQRGLQ